MRLGFNLLLFTTHVTQADRPLLERLKAVGYDGVEIPLLSGTPAGCAAVGTVLAEIGLGATAVTVMPQGKSCVAPDSAGRAAALDHLKWAIDCAHASGADTLVGPFHQPLGEFTGAGPSASEIARLAEVHREAAALAAAAGLVLAVEPLNRFECYVLNTAEQAAALVAAVDAPNYRYLYDTFHANIEEEDPVGAIARTASAIGHVHISENTRGTPGSGHIDFAAAIKALVDAGYDGWMTVEAFGAALPELAAAAKIWRPLFPNAEDVPRDALRLMQACLAAARR